MTKTFKWGIFSPGRIAHQFAEAVSGINGCEIIAVASSSASRAHEFASRYNIPQALSDYRSLLSVPDIDAIYVSSVHSMHANQTASCLEAGIPVLCEKPITVNSHELDNLIQLAERQQVFLMEALWTRFLPIIHKVKSWLDAGAIGELQTIHSSFGFVANTPTTDRLMNPDLAGGVLLDLGIYPIAMSQYFTKSVVSKITSKAILGETGIDEQLSVRLIYESGITSTFDCSFRSEYDNTFSLIGSLGQIDIAAPFWGATKAKLTSIEQQKIIELPHNVNGFEYQIQAAMEAIQSGLKETGAMPLKDSRANLEVMDAIRMQVGVQYPFE